MIQVDGEKHRVVLRVERIGSDGLPMPLLDPRIEMIGHVLFIQG